MENTQTAQGPLHIVHLIYTFEVGGAETMLVDIINGQIARGHRVTLLVVNRGINRALAATLAPEVNIVAMDRTQGSAPLLMMARLNWLLIRLRPDIIHAHHHKFGRLVRVRRNRLLVTIHAIGEPMVYCGTSRMIAITDAVKSDIIKRVPSAQVDTILNGIRISDIKARTDEAPPFRFRVVQVARLVSEIKGQDILIRAVAELKSRGHRDFELTFIGDGPDMESLRSLAKELGVDNQIIFAGLRDRTYIYSHLAEYDAMVHPSRSEGFGLTIAEAMAARLPLVVTQGDGPWEVADRGRLCESVPAGDYKACADAIAKLADNYSSLKTQIDEAAGYVARFDISRTVDNYIALYRDIILKNK